MKIPRGYQASATLSDGRMFTIGGSWSGGWGGKNGEVYNVTSNTWSLLPGCPWLVIWMEEWVYISSWT